MAVILGLSWSNFRGHLVRWDDNPLDEENNDDAQAPQLLGGI